MLLLTTCYGRTGCEGGKAGVSVEDSVQTELAAKGYDTAGGGADGNTRDRGGDVLRLGGTQGQGTGPGGGVGGRYCGYCWTRVCHGGHGHVVVAVRDRGGGCRGVRAGLHVHVILLGFDNCLWHLWHGRHLAGIAVRIQNELELFRLLLKSLDLVLKLSILLFQILSFL